MLLRWSLLVLSCSIVAGIKATAYAQDLVAKTEPLSAVEQQRRFHLPPGFEIQLVASEPQVTKPMNLSFDDRGRLFVTQSIEYPFGAKAGTTPRDRVLILEDFAADGFAQHVHTYLDGLNIPIGLTNLAGGVLVYSIPNICFAPDADGDDRADSRDVFYKSVGFRDTHGMSSSYRTWIDGWIYGCHGFANDSTISGRDGQAITLHSGNTYRLRADGSHIEQWTHGQVNPFGTDFDPLGNLYSADCHTMPITQLLRGAYYESFGKPHDGLGFGPRMLDHLHGSTGICGVVYYAADHFPAEWRDTVFIGNPVTGRVNHDRLERRGSTYWCQEQPDFIACDDPWFRPVDIRLGPDGALWIADFYSRIIGHYEVPLTHPGRENRHGRIWRVVYRGTDGQAPLPAAVPALRKLTPEKLWARLSDANLTVRVQATEELVRRASPDRLAEVAAFVERGIQSDKATATERAHGLWILQRLGSRLDPLIAKLADDPDRLVRVHLIKALAERPDWSKITSPDLFALVRARLADPDPFVRRAAADALGRHPHVDNVAPLVKLWNDTPPNDTHLIHTARMALRDQLLVPGMYAQLASLLASDPAARAKIADVSLGVRNAESAAFLLTLLPAGDIPAESLGVYLHDIARYLPDERMADLYAFTESFEGADTAVQRTIVQALWRAAGERGATLPDGFVRWGQRLAGELLEQSAVDRIREGLDLVREFRIADAFGSVAKVARNTAGHADLRPLAIDTCLAIDGPRSIPLLGELLAAAGEPLPVRQKAAAALGSINNDESRAELLRQLPTASERLAVEIATALAASPTGGEALLAAVEQGKATARLLQERAVFERLRQAGLPEIESKIGKLTLDLPPREERLAQLIEARRAAFSAAQSAAQTTATPDANLGRAIFTKNCAICHRLAGEGAKIGPELDGVGIRGIDRLLEDVLDPNRNVDQAFRSTQIVTTDGRVLAGLALRDEGNMLVLADNQGKEVRVPLDEIDDRQVNGLSPMPANVADIVTEEDFGHLLAFLLSQRNKPADAGK
ncbi:MAG: HEAT repeat domain-containing protein [Pirellulales bacterium]|nr:HEAT repeat domain-containing protein [Pirellulales bacterium]